MDGVRVPMSVRAPGRPARRPRVAPGTPPATPGPCLLYGYGAYEHSVDPVFSSLRLSLLDRGFVFAVAHVRGGGELGRRWYEDGKLATKRHTFSDFVACARHLIDAGFTVPERLAVRGGSAGGLLVGAVINQAPELFRAAVAEVPFVDCLTTMLDDTLPLTVGEWEEWGNPVADPDAYAAMQGLLALRQRPVAPTRTAARSGTPGSWPPPASTTPGWATGSRPSGWPSCGRPTRRDPRPAPDRAGGRPRRPVRPLRRLEGRGARVRVPARCLDLTGAFPLTVRDGPRRPGTAQARWRLRG